MNRLVPALLMACALLVAACAAPAVPAESGGAAAPPGGAPPSPAAGSPVSSRVSGEITLYASVPQDTLDTFVKAFNQVEPNVKVNLFRQGTGPVAARIATEQRAGRIQGDLVWLAEPTGVQDWSRDGLLMSWTPAEATSIPEQYRSGDYWGTRIINVVIGYHVGSSAPRPTDWKDLTRPEYRGKVGVPNPGFSGSAIGALGYFALDPGYGFPFYDELSRNGAVQLEGNQDVADGIAQGRFDVGQTLDYMIRPMAQKGSPIELIWPATGAIAVYSPIAVFKGSANPDAARRFVEFVISKQGQQLLVDNSFQPIRPDVVGPAVPAGAKAVQPNWPALLQQREDLLQRYATIFGS